MKLRSLPLYACALCLTIFMLHQISQYNAEALKAASLLESEGAFVDVSSYTDEDALLAFAPEKEEDADFFHPFDGEKILAFADGIVTLASDGVIVISHNTELSTRYTGCIGYTVAEGNEIDAGTVLADAGDDAQFEVLFHGEVVDASLYLALTVRS
ncbi:MAG: M23 family metallopeptidase [Clostridia bacterium]|nr:M23 family metallopeptidase [Clostridia bacterium]